jgi:hypothetical protein
VGDGDGGCEHCVDRTRATDVQQKFNLLGGSWADLDAYFRRLPMRHSLFAAAALIVSMPAFAQTSAPGATQPSPSSSTPAMTASCKTQASDKKLAGAAMNSFLKKCEADATKACGVQATDRKLAGAAKASFTKKCVSDAVGAT